MAEILIQRRRQRTVWPWLLGLLALALLPLPFMAADRDDRPTTRGVTGERTKITRGDTMATPADTAAVPGAATVPDAGAAGAGGSGATGGTRQADVPRSGERTTQSAAGAVVPAAPPAAAPPTRTGATTGAQTAAPSGVSTSAPVEASAPATATPSSTSFERFIATSSPRANDSEHRQYASDALRRLAVELRALGASAAGVRAIVANADSLRMPGTRARADPDHARAAFLATVRELDLLRARYRASVDTGALRAAAWAVRPDQRLLAQRNTVQTFFERSRDALQALSRARTSRRAPDRRSP